MLDELRCSDAGLSRADRHGNQEKLDWLPAAKGGQASEASCLSGGQVDKEAVHDGNVPARFCLLRYLWIGTYTWAGVEGEGRTWKVWACAWKMCLKCSFHVSA